MAAGSSSRAVFVVVALAVVVLCAPRRGRGCNSHPSSRAFVSARRHFRGSSLGRTRVRDGAHAKSSGVSVGSVDVEPVLLVPPKSVALAYTVLKEEGCLPQRWHEEGRFGIRVRPWDEEKPRGLKAIPLLAEAASCLEGYLRRKADGQSDSSVTASLRALVDSHGAGMKQMPVMLPANAPQQPKRDNTVHAELASETTFLPPPPEGSFTFAELFAGLGGFRVGLEALGGRCVFASEICTECVGVYESNFGAQPPVFGDIRGVSEESIPQHDLLVGGFPCQPFSALGSQPAFSDERGTLFMEIVRVLRARQPRAFLLENVPGLLTCDEGHTISRIISELEASGYDVSVEKVNSQCLTAQCRLRVFIVGIRRGQGEGRQGEPFLFPFIPDLGLRFGDIKESDVDLVAAGAADVYTLTDDQFAWLQNASKVWFPWGPGRWKPSRLAWDDSITDTLIGQYGRGLKKGNSQLTPRPSPFNPRRFTERECARLMGFPEEFDVWAGNPAVPSYRMLGNAVSPPVVAALAGAILARCSDVSSLCDWTAVGRSAAICLALRAVPPQRRDEHLSKLHASFRQFALGAEQGTPRRPPD